MFVVQQRLSLFSGFTNHGTCWLLYASVIALLSYHFMIIGMNCWQLVMIAEQSVKVYIEVTTL